MYEASLTTMIVLKLWFSIQIQITCVYRRGTAWSAHGLLALTATCCPLIGGGETAGDAPAAGPPDRHPPASATAPQPVISLTNLPHIWPPRSLVWAASSSNQPMNPAQPVMRQQEDQRTAAFR